MNSIADQDIFRGPRTLFLIAGLCLLGLAGCTLKLRHPETSCQSCQSKASKQLQGTQSKPVISPETLKRSRLEVKRRMLTAKLRSSNSVDRINAASDLGYLGHEALPAVPLLVDALQNDSHKWVRRAAAKALGNIGSKESAAPLKQAMLDRDPWVAHSAANAFKKVYPR